MPDDAQTLPPPILPATLSQAEEPELLDDGNDASTSVTDVFQAPIPPTVDESAPEKSSSDQDPLSSDLNEMLRTMNEDLKKMSSPQADPAIPEPSSPVETETGEDAPTAELSSQDIAQEQPVPNQSWQGTVQNTSEQKAPLEQLQPEVQPQPPAPQEPFSSAPSIAQDLPIPVDVFSSDDQKTPPVVAGYTPADTFDVQPIEPSLEYPIERQQQIPQKEMPVQPSEQPLSSEQPQPLEQPQPFEQPQSFPEPFQAPQPAEPSQPVESAPIPDAPLSDANVEQPKPIAEDATPNDVKKSPFRFLPLIVGIVLLFGVLAFVADKIFGIFSKSPNAGPLESLTSDKKPSSTKKTITYWGLWESSAVMQPLIAEFEQKNPTFTVSYVQQSSKDYRERLQDAISSGKGPDVFRYHATWVPMLKSQLAVVPSNIFTSLTFDQTFLPVALTDLKTKDGLVGIPLQYDSLVLFYNKQAFATAGLEAPTTWKEFSESATALRLPADTSKKIERAGAAVGLSTNVDHFSEILALLMMQNGADMKDFSSQSAIDALTYYTSFATTDKVWDATLPNSVTAFADGKVAMILAPSWRAFEIRQKSPSLDFGMAPVPQLETTTVNYANYWVEGVSRESKQKDGAWMFLQFLSSKEQQTKMYRSALEKTPRLFGEVYARKDLLDELKDDPFVGAVVSSTTQAKSWYANTDTHDTGINDRIVKYLEDAVTAVAVNGVEPESALATAQLGIVKTLQFYGLQ